MAGFLFKLVEVSLLKLKVNSSEHIQRIAKQAVFW